MQNLIITFYALLYFIRFINLITNKNIPTKITPKILQTLRMKVVKQNDEILCTDGGFIPENEIRLNYEKLINLVKGENITMVAEEKLSKTIIRKGGKMFSSLNSCPSFYEKLYFKIIFGSKTQSMIARSALNIAKEAKEFQQKALQIFSKFTSFLGYENIQYDNDSSVFNTVFSTNIPPAKNIKLLQQATNHPVHILTENGEYSPSSFIPFCSFGEDPVGTKVDDFDIPVCNIFRPRVRNDQLCYETDLEKMRSKDINTEKKQLKLGLVLILDYNEELQLGQYIKKNTSKLGEKKPYFDHSNDGSAFFSFNTISKRYFSPLEQDI